MAPIVISVIAAISVVIPPIMFKIAIIVTPIGRDVGVVSKYSFNAVFLLNLLDEKFAKITKKAVLNKREGTTLQTDVFMELFPKTFKLLYLYKLKN